MKKQPRRQRLVSPRKGKITLDQFLSMVPTEVYLDMCDQVGVGPFSTQCTPTDPTAEIWHSDYYRMVGDPELLIVLNKYKLKGEWEIDLTVTTERDLGKKLLGLKEFDLEAELKKAGVM